ncbi:MAG: DUF480 domain-containing protein [Desulfatitalea sp.]|nr:DUF480 domain-containing protein [Desulfatitalea sp.]
MMELVLDDKEIRVIGCLIEKQLATPEYYPLSLNALTNACNQKTNRDPVTDYDEQTMETVLDGLVQKKLINKSVVGRVPKYEELLVRARNFVPREAALLCELLLRGPQTAGELRNRASRLAAFESIEAVLDTLGRLEEWGLIERLARLPGHKEPRYGHLLGGAPPTGDVAEPAAPPEKTDPAESQRLALVEQELATLKEQFNALKDQFENFKRQFE